MLQDNQLFEENLVDSDDLYEHVRIVVDKGQALLRLDKFLMDRLPNVTRNKLQNAIRSESIRVNNEPAKVSYKVKPNDVITVTLTDPPRDTDIVPENIPLNIIYERSEEHTSELQSRQYLVCRLLLEKKIIVVCV